MATIDRPEDQTYSDADRLARRQRAERAKAIIERKIAAGERVLPADGFGLWGGEPVDGMVYQEWIRSE